MKWRLYKKDDPNTWPQIDCPMVLSMFGNIRFSTYGWDNEEHCFYNRNEDTNYTPNEECFYHYIGYIPNSYEVHELLKCKNDTNCPIGGDDDGYCMYDFYQCENQVRVNEYSVEEKRIWKEFE